jgi:hypothetical protein
MISIGEPSFSSAFPGDRRASRPSCPGNLVGASELHLKFGGVGLPLALKSPFLIE